MTEENEKKPSKREREDKLIRAVFSTPQGRELLEIWRNHLIDTPVFQSGIPEQECRQMAGVQSVYRRFIKLSK